MKQILQNPVILTIILLVFFVYFLILMSFPQKGKNLLLLQNASTVLFLFLLSGVYAFRLYYLDPGNLFDPEFYFSPDLPATQKLIGAAQVGFYLTWLLVLRVSPNSIFRSASHLLKDPFVDALLLLTLLSATWSSTPLITFIGAVHLIALATTVAQIAIKYSWLELSRFLRLSIATVGLLSFPVSLLLPSVGRVSGESWNGLLLHKNVFGALMALGSALWFISLQEDSKYRKFKLTLISILIAETFLSKIRWCNLYISTSFCNNFGSQILN